MAVPDNQSLTRRRATSSPCGVITSAPKTGGRILVVEDIQGLRELAVKLLRGLGYETLAAENAAAAINILDSGESINLLFTDVLMPGTPNGIGLAREVRRRFPRLPIVFTTAYCDAEELRREMATLGAGLVPKPYRRDTLASSVRVALGAQADLT